LAQNPSSVSTLVFGAIGDRDVHPFGASISFGPGSVIACNGGAVC
jgi:hypothetical protein